MSSLAAVILLRRDPLSLFGPRTWAAPATEWSFLGRRFVLVNEPAVIEHVLVGASGRFGRNPMSGRMLRPVLGEGLLTAEGETWRVQRDAVAPAFRRQRLEAMSSVVSARIETMLDAWDRTPGEPLDVTRWMSRLALESVAAALFSVELGARADALLDSMQALAGRLARPGIADALARPGAGGRRRATRGPGGAVRALIGAIVAERLADPDPPEDLLSTLVETAAARGEDESHLVDQVVTLLVAGHETTAVALGWAWYLLARHADAEARLHEEVDTVLGARSPTHADLPRLTYTRALLDETLRLYPPALAISRLALEPDPLGPRGVRPGDLVLLSPYATQRNPALWDDALAFRPERFLTGTPPRYGYFPFGAGTRACIGRGFAVLEATLTLASVARRHRLRPVDERPIEPMGRLSLRPRRPIRMHALARAPA